MQINEIWTFWNYVQTKATAVIWIDTSPNGAVFQAEYTYKEKHVWEEHAY